MLYSLKSALFLFLISFSVTLTAQNENIAQDSAWFKTMKAYEDTLGVLSYAVVNDTSDSERFLATQMLIKKLVTALKEPNSFDYPFERMRGVSLLYPADSTFRIFTWQLFIDNDTYRYYGAIQMNSPELKLFPLFDKSEEVSDVQAILSNENWFGSLYYNLETCLAADGSTYYLLFGYHTPGFFERNKLLDVLTFNDGQPSFGAPVFENYTEGGAPYTQNRILLDYHASASVRLNYSQTLELIVFDHIIDQPGINMDGPKRFPDGSYEAYKYENGLWKHVDKVFRETVEQAPVPQPVFGVGRPKKDIIGRRKN